MLGPKPSALPLGDTPVRIFNRSVSVEAEIIERFVRFVKGFWKKFQKK
jgi:hypothetical protein